MSGEHVQLPADLESAVRGLDPKCEARYVRPPTRDQPRRFATCHNPADYVVTCVNPCGHAIAEPMCATHHDMLEAYWTSGRMMVTCQGCNASAQPVELRCEPL